MRETVADSEQVFKCDLVLLAMGFLGPEKAIIDDLELAQDPRSNIATPKGPYTTAVPKVYAAGGMTFLIFSLYLSPASLVNFLLSGLVIMNIKRHLMI